MNKTTSTSKLTPGLFLFAIWAFLRFFAMGEVRGFIHSNFHLIGTAEILLNHGLIIVEAALLFSTYLILKRHFCLEGIFVSGSMKRGAWLGVLTGLIISLLSVPVVIHFGMEFSPQFSVTSLIGNLFSNFGEEVIYRGILFSAGLAVFRSTSISIAFSAIAFGAAHWDAPFLLQVYLGLAAAMLGVAYVRGNHLVAPFVAHMIVDVIIDSLFH